MQKFTPKQYLQIDIANSMGLDKLDWNERIEWFTDNEHQLLNLLSEAEEPAMYYAGVKAWEDVKAGRPTGYPVSLDATASGIQILACLTGDRSAAQLTNVIDTGHRSDAYTSLFQAMQNQLGAKGSVIQITRKDLKSAIMPAFYGSEQAPKDVFGEGSRLLATFYQVMEEMLPGAWQLNQAFLAMWNPKALKYSWVLPDNFHVHIKVMDQTQETVLFMEEEFTVYRNENKPIEKGRSLGANVTHSLDGFIVRELLRRCDYNREQIEYLRLLLQEGPGVFDPSVVTENTEMVTRLWELYEKSGYLSARILDYLDEQSLHLVDPDKIQELLDSLPKKPFKIISVHDCFRVHPNYGNDLREQYNRQLYLIAKSQMLEFLLAQIVGKKVTVNKLEDFADEILQANYALS